MAGLPPSKADPPEALASHQDQASTTCMPESIHDMLLLSPTHGKRQGLTRIGQHASCCENQIHAERNDMHQSMQECQGLACQAIWGCP